MILDHVWTLYQNLDDTYNLDLAEACWFFHKVYGFDIDELPPILHNDMIIRKAQESND